jgi:hypothetical protein
VLHEPPATSSLKLIVNPTQTGRLPPIASGIGFTDTVVVVLFEQPLTSVTLYIIVVVPAVSPVTVPVDEFTIALDVLLLLHEVLTPDVASLSEIDEPTHTLLAPSIPDTEGNAFTVIFVVTIVIQPKPFVTL